LKTAFDKYISNDMGGSFKGGLRISPSDDLALNLILPKFQFSLMGVIIYE
jgi:hypothetical protein